MIRCYRTRNRIQALLDERADPRSDPAIIEHAARCHSCADALGGLSALRTLADRAASAPMPESGGAEVRARVRAALAGRERRPVAWRAQAAWSAAALAFLVFGIHAGGRLMSAASTPPTPAVASAPAPDFALEPPTPAFEEPKPVVASAPEPTLVADEARPVPRVSAPRRSYVSRRPSRSRDVEVLPVRAGGGTTALVSQSHPLSPDAEHEDAPIVLIVPGQGL